jgi:nitrous oxide reductase accessory protein NosL
MKRNQLILILFLMLTCVTAYAADTVEGPQTCQICGMDRTAFARSRMLIIYNDGATVGLCSLQCATEEMNKNKGRQIKSLLVADYNTTTLIDARTATWVIGGKKAGVMTAVAKWAFANKDDAMAFVKENGGRVATFDEALKAASEEAGAQTGHGHDHSGPGGALMSNPATGVDIYHTHPAGSWMVNYKFMHMVMNGLRDGTSDVAATSVTPQGSQPYGYMMAPTSMTMNMNMLMLMYGLTDRLTLMATVTYQEKSMDMVMNMGMGNRPMSTMSTRGIGDSELRAIYQISKEWNGSLGVSLPTGNIDQNFTTMGMQFRAPYDMQLGSGTYDLIPALTYSALSDDKNWNWGAQASYAFHLGENQNDYTLGDIFNLTAWLRRAFGPATAWFRIAYNYTDRIHGSDPEIAKLLDPVMGASTPDADPKNYGGQRIDGFIGASYAIGPVSIGAEAGIPFYQYMNGLQLKNDWYLTAGILGQF